MSAASASTAERFRDPMSSVCTPVAVVTAMDGERPQGTTHPRTGERMKAVQFAEYGGPDVLALVGVDEPHPGPGQVRVTVRATGVNPFDAKLRSGVMAARLPVALPRTVGTDVAGIVDPRGTTGLREAAALAERGRLCVPVARTYPLDGLPAAHREIETGHVRGKLVVEL